MRQKRTEQKLGELQQMKLGLCVALTGLLFLVWSICIYQSTVVKPNEQKDSAAQTEQDSLYAEQDKQPLQEAGSIAAPQKVMLQQTKSETTQKKMAEKVQENEQEIVYRLAVENGCLQVYIDGSDRLYMATTIAYELLPEDVQAQVTDGKLFETEERLLEFLESYSS